jgi:hypothetical protein
LIGLAVDLSKAVENRKGVHNLILNSNSCVLKVTAIQYFPDLHRIPLQRVMCLSAAVLERSVQLRDISRPIGNKEIDPLFSQAFAK